MQQNRKCMLCEDRDETINHMISKCSKLAQKENKTRHDWVGKVIYWELCKKFIFNYTRKWYMHNPESVLENETHKILWYFEIQTNNLILARWPDLVIVNKKENLQNSGLCHSNWSQGTGTLLENWKNYGTWKWWCNWCTWYSHQRIDKVTGGLGNKRMSGDHPNDSTIKISQNTEKSPGDLRRLAVTQTLVEDHHLTLVWKTLKGVK